MCLSNTSTRNKMKNYSIPLFFVLFLTLSPCLAQDFTPPCSTSPTPADFCDLTCANCFFDFVQGNNQFGIPTGNQPLCGGLVLHNTVWYAFVAGSERIGFELIASDCFSGNGLQMAIMESCDQLDPLVCNPGASGSENMPLQLSYNQFIPGKTYYLLIDGFSGDICNFEMVVSEGITVPIAPDNPTPVQGPAVVCPGGTYIYFIEPVYGAGYYHWTAPPGSTINGFTNNVFMDAPDGYQVTVTFGNAGGNICVTPETSCIQGTTVCKPITVQPIPTLTLPPTNVLFQDLPYIWPLDGIELNNIGVYTLSVTLQNWQGCDSIVRQVVTVLPPSNDYVTGTVFWDNNNNGFRDVNEQPYTAGAVVASSAGQFTNTDLYGRYFFTNQTPNDTLRAVAPLPGTTVNPAFRKVQSVIWNGYDFGLFPVPNLFDLNVSMSVAALRPGFSSVLAIHCQNIGLVAVDDAVLQVTLPGLLTYLSAILPPNVIIGNDYTWNLGTMLPGDIRLIKLELLTPVGTPIGTGLNFFANILPVQSDQNPVNNFYSLTAWVVGSYDPNDKQVEPPYVTPGMLANGAPFEYTIRFQNTGNYPAEIVRIVDTLGDMVDPASFRFLAASHPCTWKLAGTGVVEFNFPDINLPDSIANEPESHGFVKFSVKPKKNLSLGTVVRNFCDIYFDFNDPVRTNTAGTQVVYFLPGQGLDPLGAMILRPNPAAFMARCDWKQPAPADGRIRLFDVTGLPKMEIPVVAGQTSAPIELGSLPAGMYFVVLEAGSMVLTNKLVVVTGLPLGWN